MKSIEKKLFNVIQGLLENSKEDQRLILSGVSGAILNRLLRLIQRKEYVLQRNGKIVPVILFSVQEHIIQSKNNFFEYNGDTFAQEADAINALKKDQAFCHETGWALGDGAFCTDVRNKCNNFVVLSPLEEPSAIGSIKNAVSEIGLQIKDDVSLGSYILKNDFFCQLLPGVAGENIWGKSDFSKLTDIFSDFSPAQIWDLADELNSVAEQDNLNAQVFEALMGLPFSGKDKISKDMLKKQLAVAGKLLESFAEIESFNNLIQRIKDVADDPDATWITQFESDVKSKVIHPQYFDDTFFRDYAELVTSNGIDNIPEWWRRLDVDFLSSILSSEDKEALIVKLDPSTIIAGDINSKSQPIVARQEMKFNFVNGEHFEQIDVLIGKKEIAGNVPKSETFEYYTSDEHNSKKCTIKFVATQKGKQAILSHDIIMLSEFAPGCYVTLSIPELIKKNTPFKAKGKTGKKFIGSIRAIHPVQNAQFLLFIDPSYELVLDSVKYKFADTDTEYLLNVEEQEPHQKYSFICEIVSGGEISFCLKRKREKFYYSLDIEAVDAEPEVSASAYQDLLRQDLTEKIKPADISYDSGFISSILSQKHMEDIAFCDEPIGYPVVLSNDIERCFRMASFRSETLIFTEKSFEHGDPRPSYESWLKSIQSSEGQEYYLARKKLFAKIKEHYSAFVLEQCPLKDFNSAEEIDLKNAFVDYLAAYGSWLKSDYDNAIITDTFWGYTNLTEHQQLREIPDFIFLPPEHPLRLGWQYLAQTMISSMLEQKKFSKIVTSFDPSSNPDYFVIPVQSVFDKKIKYCDFFSVKSTSDYWGVLYRFRDEVNQEDACAASIFSGNWGFEIPSLTKTISKGEITTALNAVKDVCIAKDILNIDLKPKHAFNICNQAVLEWFKKTMSPETATIDALGPRQVNVYASGEGIFPESEIMEAREISQDRLFWYTQKANKNSKVDVTIASLSGKSATPYAKEPPYTGIVTAGGLLRYRTRFRGISSGSEIVESRKALAVEMPDDWAKDSLPTAFREIENIYLSLVEAVETNNPGQSGYLKFSTELQNVLAEKKSYYYAFSSSDVDHACFMPSNSISGTDTVYLWDYTLPGVDTNSRNTEGFFLLAPEAETMLQAVGHAFESICAQKLDDKFLRETLFMTAKRGIPTVKKLASGGTNAMGEVGTLITLNALQGNLLKSCSEGLLPAILEKDGGYYVNILVPMDAFRERFEQLYRETGIKHPCRPDIVVFSIFCLKEQELIPQTLKVSFVEVKARNGKFSDSISALNQYSDIHAYFNSPDTHPIDQIAKKDFIVAMLMFGLRVYEALDVVAKTKLLDGLYSKVLQKIWHTDNFLYFNDLSRLFVVHNTEKSKCSDKKKEIFQTIELSKADAYSLIVNAQWPDFFTELNHWDLLAATIPSESAEIPQAPLNKPITEDKSSDNPTTGKGSVPFVTEEKSNSKMELPISEHSKSTETNNKPEQQSLVIPHEPINTCDLPEVQDLLRGINSAFEEYKINSKLKGDPIITPNMILFDFKGTPSCTKYNIEKKKDEFFSTHAVKIMRVEPKSGFVRIYVERQTRETLLIESVWKKHNYTQHTAMERGILLAEKEDSGEALYLNPAESGAPHSLIAGTTGSGKSVLMQNMLLALTKNFSQKDVKVILIDPKKVDFVEFSNISNVTHCTNQKDAIALLKDLVDEMESRYSKFEGCGAKKISQYRKKGIAIDNPMPFIWMFHDEFAEWFMDKEYQEQVETYVNKLGVLARAAGIYLVFATQRPDKDVCPMQLRSNLGNRFILKVADSGTSELALGDKSLGNASELLGRGHMIAVTETFKGYCQVPYVSEEILDTWLN